jgi:CubicO group peptidase (beta-lactamase class C family)
MQDHSLPRSTPAEQGVDATGIDAFIAAVAPLEGVELHSLMVVRHGSVVAERWWHPYAANAPHLLYSLSKSFTSTALGFAVTEGRIDLDATVLSYFPEFDAQITDQRSRGTKVRHVASMASGHADETVQEAYRRGDGDLVLGLLLIPPDHDPGTFFAYNQPCTNALARIICKVTGGTLNQYLLPRLYEPLGIGVHGWTTDGEGREIGFSGLHSTTEAIAKLGQVYLDEGKWEGKELLPRSWMTEATRSHVVPDREDPDWSQGYGFQFWRSRHGYRGDGAYGQYMVILPEADAVVAITSQSPAMQLVLDALWEHLLPVLTGDGGPSGAWPTDYPSLASPKGAVAVSIADGSYHPGPGNALPSLRSMELVGGDLILRDDGPDVRVQLGEAWTATGPFATAATSDGGRLHVDVIFAETPHRLHVVADPATSQFDARWETEPLQAGPLAELRMPRTA